VDRGKPPVVAGARSLPSRTMTVIKINAITVPAESGDELGRRFAARAGAVDRQDGFEGFELLRPTDDRTTWLVVTRWRDDAAFDAWVSSPAFGHGHQGPSAASSGAPAGGAGDAPRPQKPLAMSSELWSYETAHKAGPR
jgi:heme oxygenase (mycobilin-producing)